MKSALTYLFTALLFGAVCTESFIIYQNHKEIIDLKTKDAQLFAGISRVYDIDVHVFEQNEEFATEINACHLFIAARGLSYIYKNTHSPDEVQLNGHSKG